VNSADPRYDVVVVGGGMVGASLGLALSATPLRVALIESVLPGKGAQPSFDDRCTALANGSRRMLETLGVWSGIAPQSTAIQTIHVSDAGEFGSARLEAEALGLPALGYTAPNRVLGTVLWTQLIAQAQAAGDRLSIMAPARVASIRDGAGTVELEVTDAAGAVRSIATRLVIAADGDRSLVRKAAGIAAGIVDFEQTAIVANLVAERPAQGVAYERFAAGGGPLALLPRPDGHFTVVWTVAQTGAAELLRASDAEFLARLQQVFGWRVGAFTRVGQRASYPLALSRAQRCTAHRTVLVGNAAQSLHPVAGQGFNLGLRDAAVLAELIVNAADAGCESVLATYQQRRNLDRERMISFTDGLLRLFALSFPGAASFRSLGLTLFDSAMPAKRALSGVSWGLGAETPRLLRGLPLC
jgi:2-octaprenyl-6-methoxyphenol hydroxylase